MRRGVALGEAAGGMDERTGNAPNSPAPGPPKPVKSGWLLRRSNLMKTWKLRIVELHKDRIQHTSQSSSKPDGELYFHEENCEVTLEQQPKYITKHPTEWVFVLKRTGPKPAELVLAAQTKQDMLSWVAELSCILFPRNVTEVSDSVLG
jgi:hypothetical protein